MAEGGYNFPGASLQLRDFINRALPYSHWGRNYFDIRLAELATLDGMFPGTLRGQSERALDVGCGIGLAPAWLANRFDQIDGTDIEDLGVAFKIDRPSPIVGAELIAAAGINNVSLHCGDTFAFLEARPQTYDLVTSVFVMEHVEDIDRLCEGIAACLKPGGRTINIVPNTHDTIIQLLIKNLSSLRENLKLAWASRRATHRADGRRFGSMIAPITHSEFLSDYRDQFEVNSLEHYTFPMIKAGLTIRDIKPVREHSYAILAERLS